MSSSTNTPCDKSSRGTSTTSSQSRWSQERPSSAILVISRTKWPWFITVAMMLLRSRSLLDCRPITLCTSTWWSMTSPTWRTLCIEPRSTSSWKKRHKTRWSNRPSRRGMERSRNNYLLSQRKLRTGGRTTSRSNLSWILPITLLRFIKSTLTSLWSIPPLIGSLERFRTNLDWESETAST